MRGRTSALAALAIILIASWLVPSARPQPAEAASASFSGHGTTTTGLFTLGTGLLIAHATHNGQQSFSIELLSSSGSHVAYLATEDGSVNVQTATNIRSAGTYLLNIDADGDWTITLDQPHPTSAPGLPRSFNGHGTNITSFVLMRTGLVTFRMTHNGQHFYSFELLDVDGNTVDFLSYGIGAFNGSHATGITHDGIYFVTIDNSVEGADWSISMEQTTLAATPTPTRTPIGGVPTATFTLTPTLTPTPRPVCSPRPSVRVSNASDSAGHLVTTIVVTSNPGPTTNAVQALTFGAIRNASVQVSGVAGQVQSGQRVPIAGRPQSLTLSISRAVAGQGVFVPLTVTDACGDWPTFVGTGTGG